VSRIFEALRRAEQINNDPGTEAFPGKLGQGANMLKAFAPEVDGLADLERVTSRLHPQSHLLGASKEDVAAMERFKLLRYRLYQLRKQRTLKSVLVTSAIPREGKSMVAANLAITLAQSSIRVLLVDADLRRPSLPLLFGLKLVEGLAEILQGRAEFMALCRRIDPLGLFLLPAGRPPANPVELLQGDFMRGVVKTATSTFDWVVIDSPPVLPLADGRFLGALSDAVVLVVREGHTRREELHESLVALKGAPLAGIILNTSRSANLDAYAYYYPALPKSAGSKRPALAAQLAPNEKISNRGPVS
jgi:capsular exopolysaccharide synthesis family protein